MGTQHKGKKDTASTEQAKELAQDIKSKFWEILQNGVTNVMSDARNVWNSSRGTEYASEKAVISRSYQPVIWGVYSACLCFITFRVSGSKTFQQFRQSLLSSGRPPTRKPEAPAQPAQPQQWKSYSERQMDANRDLLDSATSLPTDFLLSFMLGISVTALTARPTVLRHNFETSPLLPGKSLLSKHLCPDMSKLHDRVGSDLWKKEDETLRSLRTFVMNCRKRQQVEHKIRAERGLPDNEEVSIPKSQTLYQESNLQ